MTPDLTPSDLVLARMFARMEGHGDLVASVPGGFLFLANRLSDNPIPGWDSVLDGKRYQFCPKFGVASVIRDIRAISPGDLQSETIRNLFYKLATLGLEMNTLGVGELGYISESVGPGSYLSKIPVERME